MPILTTTIGSYPKPSYVPVANWWRLKDSGVHVPTTTHTEYLEQRAYDNREILDRGTRAAVLDQVEASMPWRLEFDCHSPPHNGPCEADQLAFEYLAYAALRHADLATIPLDLMT